MKAPVSVLLLLFSLTVVFSQAKTGGESGKPDFNGTWIPEGAPDNVTTLKITYREPKLKITRRVKLKEPLIILGQLMATETSDEYVYYTDARGESNPSTFALLSVGTSTIKSQTRWFGDKVVVRSFFAQKESGRTLITEVTETWELSAGGKKLIETTTVHSAQGPRTLSEVYARLQNR
jgi:hypothetical protein